MGINDVDYEKMKQGLAKIRQSARRALEIAIRNVDSGESIVAAAVEHGRHENVKTEAVEAVLPEYRAEIADMIQLGDEVLLEEGCEYPMNAYLKPWDMISSKEQEPPKSDTILVKTNGGGYSIVRYNKEHGWLHEKGHRFKQEIHHWKILV